MSDARDKEAEFFSKCQGYLDSTKISNTQLSKQFEDINSQNNQC